MGTEVDGACTVDSGVGSCVLVEIGGCVAA